MTVDSWRTVAIVLGERMSHQANQCPSGRNPMGEIDEERYGPLHVVPEDWADGCPFCADTAAYRRFLKRQAIDRRGGKD